MPVIQSAIKKLRQARVHGERNRQAKRALKDSIDKFRHQPSGDLFDQVSSKLDKLSKTKVIHKNKAARIKSRLAKLLPRKADSPKKAAPLPKKAPGKRK